MKTDKALWISDIHLSNHLPMAAPSEFDATDRLMDQLELIQHVCEVAEAEQVERIHILGDLVDKSRVDAVTLTMMCRAVKMLSLVAPVYIQGGNHDALSVQGGRFTTEMFRELDVKNIHYVQHPEDIPQKSWLRFWPVPYGTVEDTRKIVAGYREILKADRRACEVLLLHQSIMDCKHEGWRCDIGLTQEEAREGFDYTLSGHFHQPQRFGEDQRGLYLGGPLHFRFDDAHRGAGFWVITFRRGKKWDPVFVKSKTPRFQEVLWPQKCRKARPGDYVRINVNATHAEYAKLKPAVMAHVDELINEGVRASMHHTPVYHHTKRLKAKGKDGVSIMDVIKEYVSALDVDTNGLDAKRLREIGQQAIEAQKPRSKG